MTFWRKHILLFSLSGILLAAAACDKENPAYNRENIKGTWIVETADGNTLSEKDRFVMTFDEYGMVTYYGVSATDTGYVWDNNRLYYEVYCCDLTISGQFSGLFGNLAPVKVESVYDFISHEDSSLVIGVRSYSVNDTPVDPDYSMLGMEKLPSTYAAVDSISGVWQFNTKNEAAFQDYRIQFQDDGSLVFYTRIGENEWSKGTSGDYYALYDYFLPVTLYDNPVFGTASSWDVVCFIIESVSKTTNTMVLSSGEDKYSLSFISSN